MPEHTSHRYRDADRGGDAAHLGNGTSDNPFQKLVDRSPDAIVVHQEGRVVYANATAVRWVGAQFPDQVRGQAITGFLHADSVEHVLMRMASLRNDGDVTRPDEVVLARMDGTTLDVEAVMMLTTWNGAPAYHVSLRDLSFNRTARKSLHYQAAMVDRVSEAIIATTGTGLVTKWNRAAERIYRRPSAHALAMPIGDAVGAPLDPAAVIAGGGVVHATHHTPDGEPLIMRVSVAPLDSGYALVCTDQTKSYGAERLLRKIVNSLDEGILVIDGAGKVVSTNPAAERILGMSTAELTGGNGRGIHRLPAFDTDRRVIPPDRHPVVQTLTTGKDCRGAVLGVDRPDGRRVWLRTSSSRLGGDHGYGSAVLVAFSDITAEHMARERLTHRATHDVLTGLPNRLAVLNHIAGSLRAEGETRLGAVLFIDVDNLKAVNDSLGHDSGDELLQRVGQSLRAAMSPRDVVGRLGGDEFVILVTGDVGESDLATIVAKLEHNLSEPMALGTVMVRTQASIGVAVVAPDDPRSAIEILRDADAAMYETKLTRRGEGRSRRRRRD